ncbi:M81 family metallopeptidase [soil metagenome]
MRVGIVHLSHESNTFFSTPTTMDDFRRGFLGTGAEVIKHFADTHHEVAGFIAGLKENDIEIVPLMSAGVVPSGPISESAWQELIAILTRELKRAGHLDGILAAPHGAAVTADGRSVDGEWVNYVRKHIGPQIPIIATCDPHANLSRRLVNACDAIIAYRTNPHLDQRQRGLEAARLMARTLRGEVRPTLAVALPPMAINIERQLTSAEPMLGIYRRADAILTRRKVLSNSIILGFPYADVPEMGCGAIVVTDGDKGLAQSLANELAEEMWSRRRDLQGQLLDVESAMETVTRSHVSVCLLDMGDNVGGGSPGDGTVLAHALMNAKVGPSFVALFDPIAAEQAIRGGVGTTVRLAMGGRTDRRHGEPLTATVTVRGIFSGRFTETEARHSGLTEFDMGQTAIVETQDGLTIQLTSRRVFPVSLGQLTSCKLVPPRFRAIVAKGVHAPIGAYGPVCPTLIRVNTPGVTCADLRAFDFRRRRKPMFPFEQDTKFE